MPSDDIVKNYTINSTLQQNLLYYVLLNVMTKVKSRIYAEKIY